MYYVASPFGTQAVLTHPLEVTKIQRCLLPTSC